VKEKKGRLYFNSNRIYVILAALVYECQYGIRQDPLRSPFLSVLSVDFMTEPVIVLCVLAGG